MANAQNVAAKITRKPKSSRDTFLRRITSMQVKLQSPVTVFPMQVVMLFENCRIKTYESF